MSEAGTPERKTAGALLRAAREKQGLHIAALAAAIKVAPRKLDALEHDRYDELPDATFTRALALTVCRTLKLDAQPVLALLPLAEPAVLDTVSGALNAPFRDRPGRDDGVGVAAAAVPMAWAGVGLLLAAAVVYFAPAQLWQSAPEAIRAAANAASSVLPSRSAAPAAAVATETVPTLVTAGEAAAASVPSPASTPASAPALEAPNDALPSVSPRLVQLRADDASWIEARDARGQVVFSRIVQAGESVGFDGALPIRLTVGNVRATRVSLRGKAVDLTLSTRDNVARLELQ